MAYLSSCNSARHRLQLALSQGSLRSKVSQSLHYKPQFKVRQLIASSLYDLCSKEKTESDCSPVSDFVSFNSLTSFSFRTYPYNHPGQTDSFR